MKNKFVAVLATMALALTGLLVAAPASAVENLSRGDDPSSPIILTSPAGVPEGAVSTGSHKDQCATVQTWTLTEPGEHHDATTHEETRWSKVIPGDEGTPLYEWTKPETRSATNTYTPGTDATYQHAWDQYTRAETFNYEYIKHVKGNIEKSDDGGWTWIDVEDFGWEVWRGNLTQWSSQNVTVFESGFHNAIQLAWSDGGYQYQKHTTHYQYVPTGATTHTGYTAWVKSSPSPFGYGDTAPADSDLVKYTDLGGMFVKIAATEGVWSGWLPAPLDNSDGWLGDAPVVPASVLGSGMFAPLTWTQNRTLTATGNTSPGEGWIKGSQVGWVGGDDPTPDKTVYFVTSGEPTESLASASWTTYPADAGPEGWTFVDKKTVSNEDGYNDPDVVTYYEYSDGVLCPTLEETEVLGGGETVVPPPVIVPAGAAVPVAASPRFTG